MARGDGEVEFFFHGLFPGGDGGADVGEEFGDAFAEVRGAGAGENHLDAGVRFQEGEDVHESGQGRYGVGDHEDFAAVGVGGPGRGGADGDPESLVHGHTYPSNAWVPGSSRLAPQKRTGPPRKQGSGTEG